MTSIRIQSSRLQPITKSSIRTKQPIRPPTLSRILPISESLKILSPTQHITTELVALRFNTKPLSLWLNTPCKPYIKGFFFKIKCTIKFAITMSANIRFLPRYRILFNIISSKQAIRSYVFLQRCSPSESSVVSIRQPPTIKCKLVCFSEPKSIII